MASGKVQREPIDNFVEKFCCEGDWENGAVGLRKVKGFFVSTSCFWFCFVSKKKE